MKDIRLRLSKELRRLRKEKGLSQEAAAEFIGISRRYYVALESKDPKMVPRLNIVERVEKAYRIKLFNF